MHQKWKKRCAWGTCNTESRYPERMGNIIYFITFPESKQNRAKCPQVFNPNTNEDKKFHFLVVIHSLSYNFHLLKQNVNVILCFSKVSQVSSFKFYLSHTRLYRDCITSSEMRVGSAPWTVQILKKQHKGSKHKIR